MSPKMALALIRHLPAESCTVAAIRGGAEYLGWGTDRYMMADMIDILNDINYAIIKVQLGKSYKNPPPTRMERPGEKQIKNKANMFAQIAATKLAQVRKAKLDGQGTSR